MPRIIVNEYDNTKAGSVGYSNFTVVVPGFAAADKSLETFDENKIKSFDSQGIFEAEVGCLPAKGACATLKELAKNTYRKALTKEEFDSYGDQVYTVGEEVTEPGRLVWINKEGVLKQLIPATAWVEGEKYAVCLKGNEGGDIVQNGNQIAYELIGLGYTVLYRVIQDEQELNSPAFWDCLKDKSVYDFRYICTGDYNSADAVNNIVEVAASRNIKLSEINDSKNIISAEGIPGGRGDCFALADVVEIVDGQPVKDQVSFIKAAITYGTNLNLPKTDGNYLGIFGPRVNYSFTPRKEYKNNKNFPASFHYLACASEAFDTYNEWKAVSGYTRGKCSLTIESTSVKLGEIAVNALQPRQAPVAGKLTAARAVNVIRKNRDGYYIWGNRTAHQIGEELVASDFLNIRQLCCTLKKAVIHQCNLCAYEPNSDRLWSKFCNGIIPTLDLMKADEGIRDYKIIKVTTNKKGLMAAKIRIVPIEAVEDFFIDLTLEDSVAGVTINVEE